MSISRIYLCAIPRHIWEQPTTIHGAHIDITRFVADALGCEQRIAKEVNLENEYSRYTLCCARIEQEIAGSRCLTAFKSAEEFAAALKSGRFPALAISADYLHVLERTLDEPGPERLGASFFPSDHVAAHRAAFDQWSVRRGVSAIASVQQRLHFFRLAERAGCGVVELQSAYHPGGADPTASGSMQAQPQGGEAEERYIKVPDFLHERPAAELLGVRRQKLADTLRHQMREALASGEPVGFGNEAQHDVIAEVLNEFAFAPPGSGLQPLDLRVVYADGSEALPFPIFNLTRVDRSVAGQAGAPLRVALMSMRHLELDPEIDFCWFRNRDVSRTRTLAETDQFCFTTTLDQLRDSLALGDLDIHLYHTGFEPAVLGFYRGVVQMLRELRAQRSPRRLVVVPYYYRGGTNYQAGTPWQ